MENATRQTFGNILLESILAFYVLVMVSAIVFGYGIYRRYRLWRQGASANL